MKVSPALYMHPEDKAAYDALKSIPLFPQCVQMFMRALPERMLHGINMAQKIRLGPKQLPEIYKYLPPACEALGIPEPEYYLEMNPFPNAYTYGDKQAAVTVTSGLLDYCEEDEIAATIAHECGHIACQHVLYSTMVDLLLKAGSNVFGPLGSLSMPVQLALFHWQRRAELSADRAAAIIMKGPDPVVDMMIRFAGGPRSLTTAIDLPLYLEQAREYDKLLDSQWDNLLQTVAVMNQSHPLPAVRSREILKWCRTDVFQRIAQRLEVTATPSVCPSCERPVNADWKFCQLCGAPLVARPILASQVPVPTDAPPAAAV